MAAEIIPFPKKEKPLKRASSIDLYYCWDSRLNNPLLNRLYKTEISYVERWFLHLQHLLNEEDVNHPILQLILSPQDPTLEYLIDSTEKDLAVQRYFSDVRNADAASTNVVRLNRWLAKWQSLLLYRQRLYNS
jgi:hypothetical protein